MEFVFHFVTCIFVSFITYKLGKSYNNIETPPVFYIAKQPSTRNYTKYLFIYIAHDI